MAEPVDDPEDLLARLLKVSFRAVRVAHVLPGDVIVLEVREELSQSGAANVHAQLSELWPNNKIAILDGGMRLKVARLIEQEGEG